MKRILILLLISLFIWAAPAQAKESLQESAEKYLLTLGYTDEEVAAFTFTESQEDQTLTFHPANQPQWQYILRSGRYGAEPSAESPFDTLFHLNKGAAHLPGEKGVRAVLREAEEKGWLRSWNKNSRTALQKAIEDTGAISDPALNRDDLPAAQAVHALFLSCCGDISVWSPALWQWRNAVLTQYGLDASAVALYPVSNSSALLEQLEPITEDLIQYDSLIYFEGLPPLTLRDVLKDARLSGWSLESGLLAESRKIRIDLESSNALMIYRKGEERRLILAWRREVQEPWQLMLAADKALLPGQEVKVLYNTIDQQFVLFYPRTAGGLLFFTVGVSQMFPHSRQTAVPEVAFSSIASVDPVSGEAWQLLWDGRVVRIAAGTPRQTDKCNFNSDVANLQLDALTVPLTVESLLANAFELPALQYGVVNNSVHLRQSTSSRSGDLGWLNQGTLLQIEEELPGDPYPWLKVRCGKLTGYVVCNYVTYLSGKDDAETLQAYDTLPVARCDKKIMLKRGIGLLDSSVCELAPGSEMHVILQSGNWLYVVVPRNEISLYMDVNGTYGFVRADDVTQYQTIPQMRWDALK